MERSQVLMRLKGAYPLLAVLCLILWLPGLTHLPALDRDESRFAEAARQMLESGDDLDARLGDKRMAGPPGIIWAEASAAAAMNEAVPGAEARIWAYRLPALAGGMASVALTFWAGSLFGAEVGLAGALLMAFSVLLSAAAMTATPDTLLLAAVMAVQGVLLRLYLGESVSMGAVLLGWGALGFGVLMGGLTVLGVALGTLVALLFWDRRAGRGWQWLRRTRPEIGLPLAILLAAPWLAVLVHAHRIGFQVSLAGAVAGFFTSAHAAPPGTYLLLSALTFWPAILFVLPALPGAVARSREPAVRFLLAWAGSWWLISELVPGRFPGHVLAAYPPLAILAGRWLFDSRSGEKQGWLLGVSAVQFLVGLAFLTLAPLLFARFLGGSLAMSFYLTIAGLIGLGALVLVFQARLAAFALALVAAMVLVPALTAGMTPGLSRLWLSRNIASLADKNFRPGDPPLSLVGYREPSLIFALDDRVNVESASGAAASGALLGGLALVTDGLRQTFLDGLAKHHTDAAFLGHVSGFDYVQGKRIGLTLNRVRRLVFEVPPPQE